MNPSSAAPADPSSCGGPRPGTWWAICLCAQWCRVCGEYRLLFDALGQELAHTRFVWVDVEDEDELVGELEVETFPTLLIADGTQARFLGPLLPQAPVLARLLASLRAAPAGSAPVSALAQAVFERVRAARVI